MNARPRAALVAALALIAANPRLAQAQEPSAATPPPGPPPAALGSLARHLFDDALGQRKLSLLGWAEATAAASGNDSDSLSPGGFFNQDDGVNFNQLGLMFCRSTGCPPDSFGPGPLANRIGAFPGPRRDSVEIGFNVTAVYGEDVQFLKTLGLDDTESDVDDTNKLGLTQAFVDIQLPLLAGTSVLIGSFQTPLAADIGYPFNPPNWFVTKTYAFQHGPAKHVGVLAQSVVPTAADFGLLSVEYGVVQGWNNYEDENDNFDFIGGVRYRSPSFKTWVDLEVITGDGNNEFGPSAGTGGSPFFALSSTGETLERTVAFLNVTHQLSARTALALESTYGTHEAGDVAPAPIFFTEDATWYGANLGLRRQLQPKVTIAGRLEYFRDDAGAHVLWAGSPGSIVALTGTLEWTVLPNLRLRGEVRHDRFDGESDAAPIFDSGTANEQTAAYFNTFIPF